MFLYYIRAFTREYNIKTNNNIIETPATPATPAKVILNARDARKGNFLVLAPDFAAAQFSELLYSLQTERERLYLGLRNFIMQPKPSANASDFVKKKSHL